jgi:glycosyltransferase involved in cell wall biosynthesis
LYTATALPKRGGQEIVVDALAREFLKLNHQVVVLAPLPRSPVKAEDSTLPYPVVRHPRFYSTHRLVGWYRWFLVRLFRKQRFDLLHCHGIYPPGYLGALSRGRLGVPIVMTSHEGGWDQGHRKLSRPIFHRRYVHALRAADALVAVSQLVEDDYRSLCPQARLIVKIPNGVDLQNLASRQGRPVKLDPTIGPGKYVLYLGRLKHRKGVDWLLKAFAQMPLERPEQLVIAGDGEDGPALKTLAARLGLRDRVRFVGWVDGQLKRYLLQNAVCTVVPSRLPETFGLIVLESYAAGRPVIAGAIPGLRELILENRTGLLVEPESIPALAQALREMIDDPLRATKLGGYGHRWVQNYSWKSVAQRHLELYDALMTSKPLPLQSESVNAEKAVNP